MAGDLVGMSDYGLGSFDSDFGDYEVVGGNFSGDASDLNKALSAGADINNPGQAPGEGFPLRVESLDSTLYNVTYSAQDIKFWKRLYKDPAYNTIEEFNRLESYGSSDAVTVGEGELPEEDDSEYSRQYTKIKFMGVTRRVTHVMSVIKAAHGDAIAREVQNGTLHLLKQLEQLLFVGNEDMVPTQFDGIETLMVKAFGSTLAEDGQYLGYEDTVHVIDCRGEPLTEDLIADLNEQLIAEPNYGRPSDIWCPTGVLKDLTKIMFPKARYDIPAPKNGVAGANFSAVQTPFGVIDINADIFIPDSKIPLATGVGKAHKRPATPTVAAPTSPVYAGVNTTMFNIGDAGTYYYKIVAGNRYGRSAPATTAAVTVSSQDQVSIGVTDNGPGTTYYDVYRSDKDGSAATCRLIMRVRRTGASQTIVDLNRFLPNTSKAYMLSHTAEVFKFKQLAPFTKMNLAQVDPSIRWMQLLYGGLQMQKPKYNGMFINVGKLATGVNA